MISKWTYLILTLPWHSKTPLLMNILNKTPGMKAP